MHLSFRRIVIILGLAALAYTLPSISRSQDLAAPSRCGALLPLVSALAVGPSAGGARAQACVPT